MILFISDSIKALWTSATVDAATDGCAPDNLTHRTVILNAKAHGSIVTDLFDLGLQLRLKEPAQ
jgi:hypothetical protein